MTARWKGEIKVLHLYTCAVCGKQEEGDRSFTYQVSSIKDIEHCLRMAPTSGIPVGWVSNGADGLSCGDHK